MQNLIYYMIEEQNLDYKLVVMLRVYLCHTTMVNGNNYGERTITLKGLKKLKDELIFLKEKKTRNSCCNS